MIINIVRKPLIGSVCKTTSSHQCGGLNIDASRIGKSVPRFPSNFMTSKENTSLFPEIISEGHWAKTKVTGFGEFGGGEQHYFGVGDKDKEKGNASKYFFIVGVKCSTKH